LIFFQHSLEDQHIASGAKKVTLDSLHNLSELFDVLLNVVHVLLRPGFVHIVTM
jgi:hypothetical protein